MTGEVRGVNPREPAYLTHYVVVRTDIPTGLAAAQIVHASGESAPRNLPPNTHAVVLGAKDEAALMAIESRLEQTGVDFVVVREDVDPVKGERTAIGVEPCASGKLRAALSDLRLYRGCEQ